MHSRGVLGLRGDQQLLPMTLLVYINVRGAQHTITFSDVLVVRIDRSLNTFD